MWEQLCGVTAEEVSRQCALWRWDGDSLVVWAYPIEQEQEVQRIRSLGKMAGLASAAKRKQGSFDRTPNRAVDLTVDHEVDQMVNHTGQRKEKKRKEMKRNEKKAKENADALAQKEANSELDLQNPPVSADKKALSFVSVPSWEEITAFCEQWPGDPATGIPPKIPLGTAAAWGGWYNGKQEKPADWRQSLVYWYRRSFIESRQAKINVLQGELSTAEKIAMRKDLERIERRIDEIRDKAPRDAFGVELTEAQADEIRRLQAKRKEIMDTLGMVA
jgi:hypothetical protein